MLKKLDLLILIAPSIVQFVVWIRCKRRRIPIYFHFFAAISGTASIAIGTMRYDPIIDRIFISVFGFMMPYLALFWVPGLPFLLTIDQEEQEEFNKE